MGSAMGPVGRQKGPWAGVRLQGHRGHCGQSGQGSRVDSGQLSVPPNNSGSREMDPQHSRGLYENGENSCPGKGRPWGQERPPGAETTSGVDSG